MSNKVEAAIEAGIKRIIVPHSNLQDIVIGKDKLKDVKILPVEKISQVLKEALVWEGHMAVLKKLETA